MQTTKLNKKIVVFLGMLAVSSTAFAQQFFIEGYAATNFESVTPTIGIGIELKPIDIIAGINFSINEVKLEYGNPYSNSVSLEKWNSVGIYAGIAPKAVSTEKWTLSFPLLVQIRFGGTDYERNHISIKADDLENSSRFGVDFLAGARLGYSLTKHWSIFTGFVFNIIEYTKWDNRYYVTTSQTGGTYSRTETAIHWLNTGKVQLGVRLTL